MTTRMTAPPSTLDQLFIPNKKHEYFKHWDSHPFRPEAEDFDLVNAWWLAEACMLIYGDGTLIARALTGSRLGEAGFSALFFEACGTQCFVLSGGGFAVVAFRGTQMDNFWQIVIDAATDAQFVLVPDGAGGCVHKGFQQGVEWVWGPLSAHLRHLSGAEGGAPIFWFAGHSLGGALATIAADRAQRELGLRIGGLYTFGAPRVGDHNFKARLAAQGLAGKTFRLINDADIVARVPPEVIYENVGRLKFIDGDGRLQERDADSVPPLRETLPRRIREAITSAPFVVSSLKNLKLPLPKPLADHAPIYYVVHLWNSFNP